MKLPEVLKRAVLEQDWKAVCAVYTAITGESLSPPPPKVEIDLANMDISEELLEELGVRSGDEYSQEEDDTPSEPQSSIILPEDYENEDEFTPQTTKKKVEDPTISKDEYLEKYGIEESSGGDSEREARRQPMSIIRNRKNKFQDNLKVASNDLKENNPVLKQVYDKVKGHSTRDLLVDASQTGKKIQVSCALCKKDEMVAPSLASGYNKNPKENTYRCTECSTPSGRIKALRQQRELEMSGPKRSRRN
jgi:hypothetical protein